MSIRVLLVEVAGVELRLREALCLHKLRFFAVRGQIRPASASPYRGFSSFQTIGMPRSSKKRSSGGG
eukprot:4402678-Pleurochrysis_carterae.AAC.1